MTFSILVRDFAPLAHSQPDQAKRQQAAQFGAAFGRLHMFGWHWVGAFHCFSARGQGVHTDEKPVRQPRWDKRSEGGRRKQNGGGTSALADRSFVHDYRELNQLGAFGRKGEFMQRKSSTIGPVVLALIDDARTDPIRAALAIREGGDVAVSPQRRHRSVKFQAVRHDRHL